MTDEEKRARHREANRKWQQANKEKVSEKGRKWRSANPEKCREYSREFSRKQWAENPEKMREKERARVRISTPETRERERVRQQKRRQADPEPNRKAAKKWAAANPERVRENKRKWLSENADLAYAKDMKNKRKHYLNKAYKLTLEEWNDLATKQENRCAICGKHRQEIFRGLMVDHDHKTGKVRGLLCFHCNAGMGNLRDDVQILQKAIAYLQSS